jgi:hypothetical protein
LDLLVGWCNIHFRCEAWVWRLREIIHDARRGGYVCAARESGAEWYLLFEVRDFDCGRDGDQLMSLATYRGETINVGKDIWR